MSNPERHPVFDRCELVIDYRSDTDLASKLMGEDAGVTPGPSVELADETVVRYQGVYKKRDIGGPEAIMLTLEIARDVGVGTFSAWLYEKLKDEKATISTPRGSVILTDDMDAEELAQVLEVLLDADDED